jgi:hypothetical protein
VTRMYEPTQTTYSATPDETLIADAIEALPQTGERHHTLVHLQDQTVCLSVARAPAREECWLWFSSAAAERADLDSERLLPLVSAGNFDGWFYVAHEIGAAVPLSEYRRVAELSTARSLALLLGISHALDDAVSQGKPPTEVTPDSVFLDPRMGAMIGDLGVAREALGNPAAATDAHAPWVAPEVLRGEGAHARSAVYSFGAIAFTLLTGGPPHRGTPQQIAEADPPRISDLRTDLPATLDTVFAVALARDPSKRYATAAEARHLLNLVIYGAPNSPSVEPSPRFGRKAPVAAVQPLPRAPKLKAPPVERPRLRKLLVGTLLIGALAGGAVAGTVAAGGDETPTVRPPAAASGMAVDLPEGWVQQPERAGRLVVHPAGEPESGLTIVGDGERFARGERGEAVLLGDHEAWRREAERAADGSRSVSYAIPTEGGGAVGLTCAAAPGAPTNTLAMCERTASTLQLNSKQPVGLETVLEQEQRWHLAAGKLSADRAAGRKQLDEAKRQRGQIAVAERLARTYERDAQRFANLPGGAAVRKAAGEAADAYRALAAAARQDSSTAWNAARERVREADEKLARAVAAG